MKRILITGKESYIGTKVEEWLNRFHEKYKVDTLEMRNDSWKDYDFHGYDVVYHVAGIAHRKKVSTELYEQVNHILVLEVANKASAAGVGQFIFMSSGAVYSQSDKKHRRIIVDEKSQLAPSTAYGISKMKAEWDLIHFNTKMKIAIIRPPMVYGPGAKGNYNSLSKCAKKLFFFPKIANKRSMIYTDNLCEFIKLLIDYQAEGIFLPQNREYVNTSELVKLIAEYSGKNIALITAFNGVLLIGSYLIDVINKVFGDFYYKKQEYFENRYQIVDFETSIQMIEKVGIKNG